MTPMRASSLQILSIVLVLAACGKKDAPATTHPDDGQTTQVSESNPGPGPSDSDVDPEAPTAEESGDEGDESEGTSEASTGRAPGDPVSVPEDPASEITEPTSFANVKLEVKMGPKVYRDPGKVIRWDELTKIPLDIDGQTHDFVVLVSRENEKSDKVEIMMSYVRGGTEILRKYTFDVKAKKREAFSTDDGTALAVTVTPQIVKPAKSGHKKVEKVEGDDPLVGAGERGEPAGTKKKGK